MCFSVFCQQEIECGTDVSSSDIKIIQQFIKTLKTSSSALTPLDSIVPIKFHIIGYSNGSSMIDSLSVFNEIDLVNTSYFNAGIRFKHCGNVNYIQDSDYALFEKINDETLCDSEDIENVLNVYFVPRLYKISNGDTVNICGYAYLSGLTKNRIIMKNSCATNGSTLSHEIGHYFSLFHTHSSSLGDELVNGSNCNSAGDTFCDTPADPTLSSSSVTSSCIYIGNEQDSNGDFYDPDVNNFMSYSRKSCRDFFSNDQLNQIAAYFFNYRNYLNCPLDIDQNLVAENLNFNIFPNPADEIVYINSNHVGGNLLFLKVHDLTGRLILDVVVSASFILDVQSYSLGSYFLTLSSGTEIRTKKFVKAR